jgi:uncharacterized membrane-anchored protein
MENQNTQVMSVKDWLITYLIAAIPLVGFIMLFVWAFSSGENANKSNWAKATLLWMVIVFILVFLLWITVFATMLAAMSGSM